MSVDITILCENTAARLAVAAEWGFSALIESGREKILLDTGQTSTAVNNAQSQNIDLSGITRIVLSHGHSDHTGGLYAVLSALKREVEIIAHPDIWASKYAFRSNKYNFVGVPFRKEQLENLGARFMLTREAYRINDSITVSGEITMKNNYEDIDNNLFIRKEDKYIPDPLFDDRSVAIKTDAGLVIISGCAHRGIINTIDYFKELTGVELINAVIGGTHLIRSNSERIEKTIRGLREAGVMKVGASHCTGMPAAARLLTEFGDNFIFCNSGLKITLP